MTSTCTNLELAKVLVIGAGPAGLATAKRILDLGIGVAIVDRFGNAGGAYSRMYPELILSSPTRFLSLPGKALFASTDYIRAKDFAAYLADYAEAQGFSILHKVVVRIEATLDRVKVSFANGVQATFAAVVAATGMTDFPVWPDLNCNLTNLKTPVLMHAQDWRGPSNLPGRRILIVGGRARAVEIAEECVRFGLRPFVAARDKRVNLWPLTLLGFDTRFFSYPLLRLSPTVFFRAKCASGWRFRGTNRGFRRFVREGKVILVEELVTITDQGVLFADKSIFDFDIVVFATGYRFDMDFLPPGVARSKQGYPLIRNGRCDNLPNVFFVGVPCAFHLDSQFIHGIARDSWYISDAVAKIVISSYGRRLP